MKRLVLLALCAVFTFTATASGTDLKAGYVDFNRALNESEEGKKATTALEKVIEEKKSILAEKEKEIKVLDEELKKQMSVLSQDARLEKEDTLKKLVRDAQRMSKDFQEELQKKETDLTREIQNDLMKIIDQISRDESYTVVFERGAAGILYFDDAFDMTDKVIKRYNESIKTKK